MFDDFVQGDVDELSIDAENGLSSCCAVVGPVPGSGGVFVIQPERISVFAELCIFGVGDVVSPIPKKVDHLGFCGSRKHIPFLPKFKLCEAERLALRLVCLHNGRGNLSRDRGINASAHTGFYAAKALDKFPRQWYIGAPSVGFRDEESQGNPSRPGMV